MTAFVKIDSIAIDFYRAIHYSAYVKHGLAIACRPSVRLSVCDVGGLWSHRLEILETNSTYLQDIFARKLCMKKINKMLELYEIFARKKYQNSRIFLWYLPEQLTKFPNFTYLPENARILRDNYPKNTLYFREFYWGGARGVPPYPTPMIARTSIYSPGNR